MSRLAAWFREAVDDPEAYGAMIFCQDDGPFRPQRRSKRTAAQALETQVFADGVELRILPEGSDTHWRTLELARRGEAPYRFDLTELPSPPTFERAPPPLRLGPYGWRLHLRFGSPGDMERAYLYLDAELEPLFYHLTW